MPPRLASHFCGLRERRVGISGGFKPAPTSLTPLIWLFSESYQMFTMETARCSRAHLAHKRRSTCLPMVASLLPVT
jgi:hypothetical protein